MPLFPLFGGIAESPEAISQQLRPPSPLPHPRSRSRGRECYVNRGYTASLSNTTLIRTFDRADRSRSAIGIIRVIASFPHALFLLPIFSHDSFVIATCGADARPPQIATVRSRAELRDQSEIGLDRPGRSIFLRECTRIADQQQFSIEMTIDYRLKIGIDRDRSARWVWAGFANRASRPRMRARLQFPALRVTYGAGTTPS